MTNELTYTKNGEYWIPDLTAAEQPMELSKYGRMREWFLKEHRTITYNNLLLSGKLTALPNAPDAADVFHSNTPTSSSGSI